MEKDTIRLTAPELSSLWTQYMFDSMSICFIKYALEHIEDNEIREIYNSALLSSETHIKRIKGFLVGENYPIPLGFTDKDVDIKAPRLFQDPFYLYYMYIMTLQGITGYSLSVSTSIRADLRSYYIECNTDVMAFFDKTINVMLSKGLLVRPPTLTPPDTIDFVKHQSFLTGWFGKRRPLTAMEIGDISFNMNKMHMHAALKLGFSQVAKSQKVRDYIKRGLTITIKHIDKFESIFREEKLNAPMSWQSQATNSTTSPFSDKFIMYQVQLSSQIAIAFYGTALSVTSRRDLGIEYVMLTSELMKFAEDGSNLMIDYGWLEEPPRANDRRELSKGKKDK